MKVAFIAHPIGGNILWNLKEIARIVRIINMNEKNVIPFAPYVSDLHALDDNCPIERRRGLDNGLHFIDKKYIDELRLYGSRITPGMKREVEKAIEEGIPVIATSDDLREALLLFKTELTARPLWPENLH